MRLSEDGNRLSLITSRPWLQGFIGLAFAAAGTFFLFMILREGITTKVNGVRVPAGPVFSWGGGLFCGFFILLGLIIASHRRGTTLDRESGTSTRWEGLVVSMTATRRSIRAFTTVQLESAVREGQRDKRNRPRYYRIYQVRLTKPQGSTLLVHESGDEASTRGDARKIAEFLGLLLDDRTTGDQLLPAMGGAYVGVDLQDIGLVTVSSPRPQVRMTYKFRECIDQPEGSAVRIEQYPEGITLTVPPAGILQGSKGLFIFGLIWCGMITAVGLIMVGSMQQTGKYHYGALAGIGFMGLVGLLMLTGAVQMGRRQGVIAVVNDRLMLLQVGPLGKKRREWSAEQLRDVRTGLGRMSSGGEPVIELQRLPAKGRVVRLLAGREEEELRWMATVVRQALRLPPVPDDVAEETEC